MRSKELFFTAWLIYSFSSEITVPKWRTGLKMLQTMSVINFVTYGIYYESNGILVKFENNFTYILSKIKSFQYLILEKGQVKLFSNFTSHHLLYTHTNYITSYNS